MSSAPDGRAGGRWFDPRAWPLATKLSLSFFFVVSLLTALIAGEVTAQGERRARIEERETLEDLARGTAGRLDQLLLDTKLRVEIFAANDDLERLMSLDEASRARVIANDDARAQDV